MNFSFILIISPFISPYFWEEFWISSASDEKQLRTTKSFNFNTVKKIKLLIFLAKKL